MRANEVLQNTHRAVEASALSNLLRSELAACETYRTAVHRVEHGSESPALSLRCLYRSHRKHADELSETVRQLGGRPSEFSGDPGAWPSVHERIAAIEDGPQTLGPLGEGERSSVERALSALRYLDGPEAEVVRKRVLPGLVANLNLIAALAAHSATNGGPGRFGRDGNRIAPKESRRPTAAGTNAERRRGTEEEDDSGERPR